MTARLAGPVVITGADGHVGTFVQARLSAASNEIRPVVRGGDLAAALADAEAVIHLAGTLQAIAGNTYQDANVETVRRTLAALEDSTVERVVFLSYVGADPAASNDYLRTKGEAEQLVATCGRAAVSVRSTFIYGPPDDPGPSATPFISSHGKPVSVIGTGAQRYAPVYVGDVADVLARLALDVGAPTGVLALAGPDAMTADEFADALSGHEVKERHLGPRVARVLAHVLPSLTPALVAVLAADSLPDPRVRLAADALGLELRHLADVYATVTA